MMFQTRSLLTLGKSKEERRESSGFWFSRVNFPERMPPASGLQTRGGRSFSASRRGDDFALEVAADDGVVGLEGVEAGEVFELGDAEGFGDLPGVPVGDADVADFS